MGSKLAKDLGKPLNRRTNIVISSEDNFHEEFIIVRTFEEAVKKATLLKNWDNHIFVIGGQSLFEQTLQSPHLDKIYYTHINKSFHCDKFVPSLLHRPTMNYTILDTKNVTAVDTIRAVNMIGDVKLTFYLISTNFHADSTK